MYAVSIAVCCAFSLARLAKNDALIPTSVPKIAKIAMVTTSSTRVKPLCFDIFFTILIFLLYILGIVFVNAVKNKYMKLNETLLSLVFLLLMLFNATPQNTISASITAENTIEKIDYYNETINAEGLQDLFSNTPLFLDGNLCIDQLTNGESPLKTEQFALSYNHLGYLIQEIIYNISKIDVDGKVSSVSVHGTRDKATLTFTLDINLHEKNPLTKLMGLNDSKLTATISLDTNLTTKSVDYVIDANGIKITPIIGNIACKYIFGVSDTKELITKITNRLFWGIGCASEFGASYILYNK